MVGVSKSSVAAPFSLVNFIYSLHEPRSISVSSITTTVNVFCSIPYVGYRSAVFILEPIIPSFRVLMYGNVSQGQRFVHRPRP